MNGRTQNLISPIGATLWYKNKEQINSPVMGDIMVE
jgi:hypothetical protein